MTVRECTLSSYMIFLIFAGFSLLPLIFSLPFVVLHGLGESCSDTRVSNFTQVLMNISDTQGYCIEIGDGDRDSWLLPLKKQIEIACNQVKTIETLAYGYNIVGLSQGNMIARGLIEFCEGTPKVNNYVSLGGPHAGIALIPKCGSEVVCDIVAHLIQLGVYTHLVQEHVAPTGYVKILNDRKSYLKGCQFLPYINNEIVDQRNATYKERFSSLQKLVLVMFENDKVLVPRETSWFGFYPDDGSMKDAPIPANETSLYTEDWIGLRTLDEAGKLEFFSVPGGHVELTFNLSLHYVAPYLKAS